MYMQPPVPQHLLSPTPTMGQMPRSQSVAPGASWPIPSYLMDDFVPNRQPNGVPFGQNLGLLGSIGQPQSGMPGASGNPWQQLQAARAQQQQGLMGLLQQQQTSPGAYYGMGPGSLYYQPWMDQSALLNQPAAGAPAAGAATPAAAAAPNQIGAQGFNIGNSTVNVPQSAPFAALNVLRPLANKGLSQDTQQRIFDSLARRGGMTPWSP